MMRRSTMTKKDKAALSWYMEKDEVPKMIRREEGI